jgi:hypothetical protein
MSYTDWADVACDLTRGLEALDEDEFLVLGESDLAPAPRRGVFGRRSAPGAARYVQALRITDFLSAECVGATSLGGTWAMSESTIVQLRDLGWLTAEENGTQYGSPTPNFELYVDLAATATLAYVLVASLQLLGVQPQHLELVTSSGGARSTAG